jgi:UDP-GlcNAc:undecaprenyl-phosphate GlcNAc-1-phosphate transferase
MTLNFYNLVVSVITSFGVTLFVLPHLAHIAEKIGLVDEPDGRKIHAQPKPLVGGIGMMMGVAISSLLVIPLVNLRGFYAGIILLIIIGFLDDFKEIDHSWKFVAQVVAVLFMVYYSDAILFDLGDLASYGRIAFNRAAILLTIFATLGVINAINMMDGLDGLAGGISLVALLSFAILAFIDDQSVLVLLSITFSGAVIAFLIYNWYPSRLFMGDAGSTALGFALTFLAIALTQKDSSSIPPVIPLVILVVPLVDTVSVMLRRMFTGKSAFKPDRTHLHHILLEFGFSKRTSVLIIIVLSSAFAVFGLCGFVYGIPEHYLFAVCMAYFLLYFAASFQVKRLLKYIAKAKNRRDLRDTDNK